MISPHETIPRIETFPGIEGFPGAAGVAESRGAASAGRGWALAAATAAAGVPAVGAEAIAWTVRGWAEVALGCLALGGAGGFPGLDEAVRAAGIASGGPHAARLRELRRLGGPVPGGYPDTRPLAGAVRRISPAAWRAASLLSWFGKQLIGTPSGRSSVAGCPCTSARQLAWGSRYRPSSGGHYQVMSLPVGRRLARRTWMCLPAPAGPVVIIADVTTSAPALAQQIWRGIHEGAHLDHLAALARRRPAAPSPAEFGSGLIVAESYAMAVELLAAAECVLASEIPVARQIGAGLAERAHRLSGGTGPAAEFTVLPTLAEAYVLGPLRVLSGRDLGGMLPGELTEPLLARWRAASALYPPASMLAAVADDLLG